MKNKICAGNWKLNKSPKESAEFLSELMEAVSVEDLKSFIVFPPASNWFVFSAQEKIKWGAQNTYCESSGAFTGENSPQTLKEMKGQFSLVGHSERRHIFLESDDLIAKKVKSLQVYGIIPMLCVGETLSEREAGQTENVIKRQLESVLNVIPKGSALYLAYEPVWAIGTGKVASPEQARQAHEFLRNILRDAWGEGPAQAVPILYGGSVKPDNAKELGMQNDIDGFLIGGASLTVDNFTGIFKASQSQQS